MEHVFSIPAAEVDRVLTLDRGTLKPIELAVVQALEAEYPDDANLAKLRTNVRLETALDKPQLRVKIRVTKI